MITMMSPVLREVIEDLERKDTEQGPERDETDTAALLRVVIPQPGRTGVVGAARAWLPAANGPQLQCDICSGWFGVTYWTCPACIALGYRVSIPMPTACDWCGQGDHDPIKPQDDD